MAMTSSAQPQPYSPERRMLIDGELVAATGGREFDNINPATEEVLGQVADGTADDMRRAIGAARRAFDETDWSVHKELRARWLSPPRKCAGRSRTAPPTTCAVPSALPAGRSTRPTGPSTRSCGLAASCNCR